MPCKIHTNDGKYWTVSASADVAARSLSDARAADELYKPLLFEGLGPKIHYWIVPAAVTTIGPA